MDDRTPRLYHFIFGLRPQTEPFHLVYYLCIESCIQVNRPEKVYFYYHYKPYGKYWELIKEKITPVRVDLVPAVTKCDYADQAIKDLFSYAHHSDFIRLDKLIEHGGVYADLDTIFVNKLPDGLFRECFVLGREDPVVCQKTGIRKPSLCNAFIMSRKGAQFGLRWRREMEGALDGTWSGHSCSLAYELSVRYPDEIHIEPPRSFYSYMWTRPAMARLFRDCDLDHDGIYSIHLWCHLWWSRHRRDFLKFHGGMLTERFIRGTDTTYNLIARRFLPGPMRIKPTLRVSWGLRTGFHSTMRLPGVLRKTAGAAARSLLREFRRKAPRRMIGRGPAQFPVEGKVDLSQAGIDGIYVVHCKALTDRKRYLERALRLTGMDAEWVEVMDADEIPSRVFRERVTHDLLTPQEVSLYLKQEVILRKIIDKGHRAALVLEDDIVLPADFCVRFAESIRHIPPDYDMIFLGESCNMHVKPEGNPFFGRAGRTRSMSSYIVTGKCCRAVMDEPDSISLPFDLHIDRIIKEKHLTVYWHEPPLMRQGSEMGVYAHSLGIKWRENCISPVP